MPYSGTLKIMLGFILAVVSFSKSEWMSQFEGFSPGGRGFVRDGVERHCCCQCLWKALQGCPRDLVITGAEYLSRLFRRLQWNTS